MDRHAVREPDRCARVRAVTLPRSRVIGASVRRLVAPCLAAALLLPACGAAAPAPKNAGREAPVELAKVRGGELLWRTERGLLPLPALRTEVSVDVRGILLHASVEQRFHNGSREPIEALYVFPLPERAAVHSMEFRVGARRIVAVVQERERAKTHEKARSSGRKAALVEPERPNLFTTSVANIGAGESVSVLFEYVEEVEYDNGSFRFVLPLTLIPRYVPGAILEIDTSTMRTAVVSAMAPDADRVTPAFVEAHTQAPAAWFRIRIDAGVPLARVACTSHDVASWEEGATVALSPRAQKIRADRDVVVEWTPDVDAMPEGGLLVERAADVDYALLLLMPPRRGGALRHPTETMFVIDVSGSMGGASIRHGRSALAAAIDRLAPDDRFNILCFNESSFLFNPDFVRAEDEARARARAWVQSLQAGGGTQIHAALLRAIGAFGPPAGALQRILFLTDGAVAKEAQLLRRIHRRLGSVRLHCVGIGPAPNRYLLRDMGYRVSRAYRSGASVHPGRPASPAADEGSSRTEMEL
jgi:Ca-activated chloride channel family protein